MGSVRGDAQPVDFMQRKNVLRTEGLRGETPFHLQQIPLTPLAPNVENIGMAREPQEKLSRPFFISQIIHQMPDSHDEK